MYTVYDRLYGNLPAEVPYIHRIYIVKPYVWFCKTVCMILANPNHESCTKTTLIMGRAPTLVMSCAPTLIMSGAPTLIMGRAPRQP
jgi:hypothetical protein